MFTKNFVTSQPSSSPQIPQPPLQQLDHLRQLSTISARSQLSSQLPFSLPLSSYAHSLHSLRPPLSGRLPLQACAIKSIFPVVYRRLSPITIANRPSAAPPASPTGLSPFTQPVNISALLYTKELSKARNANSRLQTF